jgi:hypothetical protein
MTHNLYITLGVVQQLAEKIIATLCCQRTRPSTGAFCYCTGLSQSRGPEQGPPVTVLCCHKVRGPAQGPSVTALCCHKAGPSTGTFCYCTVLPQSRAQHRDLLLLHCVATKQGPVWRPSVTVLYCHRLGPSTGTLWYCTVLRQNWSHYSGLLLHSSTSMFHQSTSNIC